MTIDLSAQPELVWLAQLLADVQRAAPNLELILVGAMARDLLLHHAHGVAIQRATHDVDFAMAAADWPAFHAAKQALIGSGLFVAHRHAAHKLQHSRYGWIDLIPFGALEAADGTIAWPPAGDEVMEILGYREAAHTAVTIHLPQSIRAKAVALPMLAVLKVLAWQERHLQAPTKDAFDLAVILRYHLPAGNAERLYAEHAHLLDAPDFDMDTASAWLTGHDARLLIDQSSTRSAQLIGRLNQILEAETHPDSSAQLALTMHPARSNQAVRWLAAFHAGLNGQPTP
ncbi:MAG: nucleotidyl transferase AbiEii/AbiGii toxin family protein [Hydrogenophaga sp.]|jgi:predicted nucleotidyltransferase|nr:nucleotidyl transferase AbiEii/AbiGii toxin family protein [Hydrogenophaga sp.]